MNNPPMPLADITREMKEALDSELTNKRRPMKPDTQEKAPELYCLTCGTDLQRDRFEYVCPSDGHRFQVKDGVLKVAERKLYGPGPDGVADRRRYPSLDGGMSRRTVEPKDGRIRSFDPREEEARQMAAARRAG